ncbi:hypothetical protein PFISCL1PPCAC_15309, partial [Pristionchus fissidentatus]
KSIFIQLPFARPTEYLPMADKSDGRRRSTRKSKQVEHYTAVETPVRKRKVEDIEKATKKESEVEEIRTKKEKKEELKGDVKLVQKLGIKSSEVDASSPISPPDSTHSFSRQLIDAVIKEDCQRIEKLYDDNKMARDGAGQHYSHMDDRSPITIAFQSGNENVVSTLMKCHQSLSSNSDVVNDDLCLLQKQSTGRKNIHMLGRTTRSIESTKGGREGNNAFLNYEGGKDAIDKENVSLCSSCW